MKCKIGRVSAVIVGIIAEVSSAMPEIRNDSYGYISFSGAGEGDFGIIPASQNRVWQAAGGCAQRAVLTGGNTWSRTASNEGERL